MRNFQKLAAGIVINPLLLQVLRHDELWDKEHIESRWKEGYPEIDVSEILVRYPIGDESEDIQCEWRASSALLPAARELSLSVMTHVRGEQLGRVVLTRLGPGKVIYPHADTVGAYTNFYTRFHVPLKSDERVVFRCGDERTSMCAGELYWFDKSLVHTIENRGLDDRINLIIDVRLS
jgi:hypothetical protein